MKNLKRKVVNGSYPKVTPIDSYVGGHMGIESSREGALGAITRGRFVEPAEMRQWVVSQIHRRTTLFGLLSRGYPLYVRDGKQYVGQWSGSTLTLILWRVRLFLLLPLLRAQRACKRERTC